MENYSDGSSKTSSGNQLEIERLLGVNDEAGDILDTCQAAGRLVSLWFGRRWGDGVVLWLHTRFEPCLDASTEGIPAFWICLLVFKAIQRGEDPRFLTRNDNTGKMSVQPCFSRGVARVFIRMIAGNSLQGIEKVKKRIERRKLE